MSDYVKLTIKIEDLETGAVEETVFERVESLVTETKYPDQRHRGPDGLLYPLQPLTRPKAPPTVRLSFSPTVDMDGIWAHTTKTGGSIDA